MRIEYLADHMQHAVLLADWHFREWADLLPGWTREQAEAELCSHTGLCQVPTTFLALEEGQPIGSASLLEADLDGWEHLTPWVASVFVIPEFRGRGIGRLLVDRAIQDARLLGIQSVYLFTHGQAEFYRRIGWTEFQRTDHHGRELLIMRRWTGD